MLNKNLFLPSRNIFAIGKFEGFDAHLRAATEGQKGQLGGVRDVIAENEADSITTKRNDALMQDGESTEIVETGQKVEDTGETKAKIKETQNTIDGFTKQISKNLQGVDDPKKRQEVVDKALVKMIKQGDITKEDAEKLRKQFIPEERESDSEYHARLFDSLSPDQIKDLTQTIDSKYGEGTTANIITASDEAKGEYATALAAIVPRGDSARILRSLEGKHIAATGKAFGLQKERRTGQETNEAQAQDLTASAIEKRANLASTRREAQEQADQANTEVARMEQSARAQESRPEELAERNLAQSETPNSSAEA